MQTQITYNDVTIKDVMTDSITSETVKDSTGVDQLGVRFRVEVTGVVHQAAANHTGVKVGGNFAGGLEDLLAKLTKDRRPFKMAIGGSVLFDVKPGAVEPQATTTITTNLDGMDIDHGPRPSVSILKIVSGCSATIRFAIEFTIPNCGSDSGVNQLASFGLVNFRFWIAEDIDYNTGLTARNYQGRLRVAHKGISPHALARVAAIPPLQPGFKRRVIQLHESANGLELDFTIQDQEIIAAAPYSKSGGFGAIDWHGSFSLSTTQQLQSFSELTVTLTGPKSTTKQQLIFLALQVVEVKTHALSLFKGAPSFGGGPFGAGFLEQFGVREELRDNSITVGCRIRHTANKEQLLALFAPGGTLNFGPLPNMGIGYDPDLAYYPAPTATLTGLFLSSLQTPCHPSQMPKVAQVKNLAAVKPAKGNGQDLVAKAAVTLPEKPAGLSDQHLQAMYLDYAIHSDLHISTGKLVLPTGAASNSGPNGSPPVAVIQLYNPYAIREIAIEATRIDAPPQLPAFNKNFTDANGITHTAIGDAVIGGNAPQSSADSRRLLHHTSMTMQYSLSRVPSDNESIPLGAVPYRASNFQDQSRVLPASVFVPPGNVLR
jgi:hypothetical protein